MQMTYSVRSASEFVYVDAAADAGEVWLAAADAFLSHFNTSAPFIISLQSHDVL